MDWIVHFILVIRYYYKRRDKIITELIFSPFALTQNADCQRRRHECAPEWAINSTVNILITRNSPDSWPALATILGQYAAEQTGDAQKKQRNSEVIKIKRLDVLTSACVFPKHKSNRTRTKQTNRLRIFTARRNRNLRITGSPCSLWHPFRSASFVSVDQSDEYWTVFTSAFDFLLFHIIFFLAFLHSDGNSLEWQRFCWHHRSRRWHKLKLTQC